MPLLREADVRWPVVAPPGAASPGRQGRYSGTPDAARVPSGRYGCRRMREHHFGGPGGTKTRPFHPPPNAPRTIPINVPLFRARNPSM